MGRRQVLLLEGPKHTRHTPKLVGHRSAAVRRVGRGVVLGQELVAGYRHAEGIRGRATAGAELQSKLEGSSTEPCCHRRPGRRLGQTRGVPNHHRTCVRLHNGYLMSPATTHAE